MECGYIYHLSIVITLIPTECFCDSLMFTTLHQHTETLVSESAHHGMGSHLGNKTVRKKEKIETAGIAKGQG